MARPYEAELDRRGLPSLTGMRFVAALLVFLFHIVYESAFANASVATGYKRVFGQGGWTGVAFFFVLSGFVLAWSARPRDTVPGFWRRRVAKIFPNHLVTYVVAVLLTVAAGLSTGGWRAVPGVFLIQSWFPQPDIETSANPVTWSLSCELFFYLAFPLLLWAINRIRASHLWYWATGFAALVWSVPTIGHLLLPGRPIAPWAPGVSTYEFWFVYVFPPTRLLEFVLGMLMARIVIAGRWIRLPLPVAAALAVAAFVVAPEAPLLYQIVTVTVIPLALLISAAAHADLAGKWSPLRGSTMVWLGNISFAFYLWHRLVLIYGHRALGVGRTFSTPAVAGLGLLALGVVLVLAWLTYRFVERPAMRLLAGRHRVVVPLAPEQEPDPALTMS
jgi:peptidoglycan/LPS O-acetylase OafA/YrhL